MSDSQPSRSERAMLEEARAEVALADHKASMVMAALGIGAAAVLGGLLAGNWEPKDYSAPGEGIWWLGAAVAVVAILSAVSAVWPRFSAVDLSQGIYYWGHVATFGTLDALNEAMDEAPASEADRTRHQLHKLSLIVQRKYSLVRASMVLAGLAGVLFLTAGLTG